MKQHHGSWLDAFQIRQKTVVALVGAGGKSSLMYLLARKARQAGWKVLVTTTTKVRLPEPGQCDFLDGGGTLFDGEAISRPGVYFSGRRDRDRSKVAAADPGRLQSRHHLFDLTLIEADGAAMKPLKGWNETEPVIPAWATHTIGVVDIQTVAREINDQLVHRLDIFLELVAAQCGDRVSIDHLCRLVRHPAGLFRRARTTTQLFVNKVEDETALRRANQLRDRLEPLAVVAGSVQQGVLYG